MVHVEGLDSGTVVGIAFAAFIIGVLLTAALWFIHTHTGYFLQFISSIPVVVFKRTLRTDLITSNGLRMFPIDLHNITMQHYLTANKGLPRVREKQNLIQVRELSMNFEKM